MNINKYKYKRNDAYKRKINKQAFKAINYAKSLIFRFVHIYFQVFHYIISNTILYPIEVKIQHLTRFQ